MARYILKRLLLMIPIMLGVSVIIFGIISLTPGDPASILLGDNATAEQKDALNRELGYDRPVVEQYFNYIKNLVTRFDLGESYKTRLSVTEEIGMRFPITVTLAFFGLLLACSLGIPLGVLSAVKQYSLLDTLPSVIALMLAAMPSFWLGMIFLYVFSLRLGWFPAGGIGTWRHFISPVVGLALPQAAVLLRYTRSSMLETIRQDYIRTARAKGASERAVIWGHAMKNALIPVITIVGIDFAAMLGGAVTTETLYSMPGMGRALVEAIRMKDRPVVLGMTLYISVICSVTMLVIDILYAVVDPRIKAKYSRKR